MEHIKKEREWKVFNALRFKRQFGFAPPNKWQIDFADEQIVGIVLSALERKADEQKAKVDLLGDEFRQLGQLKNLIAKRAELKAAQGMYDKTEHGLYRACDVAVKCGFRPVSRYQYIWDLAREKEARPRTTQTQE